LGDLTKKIRTFINSQANQVLTNNPIDLLGTLNMGPGGLKSIQILPDQLFGLPLEIRSVDVVGDLVTVQINLAEKKK
jgi:hypothetical protein